MVQQTIALIALSKSTHVFSGFTTLTTTVRNDGHECALHATADPATAAAATAASAPSTILPTICISTAGVGSDDDGARRLYDQAAKLRRHQTANPDDDQ